MEQGRVRIQIEPLSLATVDAVSEIERVCFSRPWSLEALRQEIGNPGGVFLVALMDGTIAGYIGMHVVLDEGSINNVAVAPEFRRRGIGAELLEQLLTEARARELRGLLLEVRAGNDPAIALYERYGFRRVGVRRGYYQEPREDAVLMTMEL